MLTSRNVLSHKDGDLWQTTQPQPIPQLINQMENGVEAIEEEVRA